MIKVIQNAAIKAQGTGWSNVYEEILLSIEAAGMLPPYSPVHNGKHSPDLWSHEWEPETISGEDEL